MVEVNRLIKAGKDVNEKDNVSDGYNHSLLPTYSTGSLYIFNKILSIPLSEPPPTFVYVSALACVNLPDGFE